MYLKFLPALFLLLAINANALPIVAVDGYEWLQPADFTSLEYTDISAICDPVTGVCSGSLGGIDLNGWEWASVDAVNDLFNYYLGGPVLGPGPDAHWEGSPAPGIAFFADGWISNWDITPQTRTVIGYLANAPTTGGMFGYWEGGPLPVVAYTDYSLEAFDEANPGAWFRRAEVSLPGSIPLIALALTSLAYMRRRSLAICA
jgi:hypothetical protein